VVLVSLSVVTLLGTSALGTAAPYAEGPVGQAKWLEGEFLERQHPPIGKRVSHRRHDVDGMLCFIDDVDCTIGLQVEGNADVCLIVDKGLDHIFRPANDDVVRDAGIAADEFRQQRQQKVGDHTFDGVYGYMAATQVAQIVDVAADALDLAQCTPRPSGNDLARYCETKATGMALEQRDAQFVLEIGDVTTEGRGRDIEFLGRLTHRLTPRDFEEIA